MLITSNRPVGESGQVFGDAVAATAILDRLLHHSQVITIRGDSYQLRDKRRSGLLQKAAAPTPITSESRLTQGGNSRCRQGVKSSCRLGSVPCALAGQAVNETARRARSAAG
jgi:hypothetical protein